MYKKFEKDDVIHNVLVANPKLKFKIFYGKIYNNIDFDRGIPDTYEAKLDFSDARNSAYVAII